MTKAEHILIKIAKWPTPKPPRPGVATSPHGLGGVAPHWNTQSLCKCCGGNHGTPLKPEMGVGPTGPGKIMQGKLLGPGMLPPKGTRKEHKKVGSWGEQLANKAKSAAQGLAAKTIGNAVKKRVEAAKDKLVNRFSNPAEVGGGRTPKQPIPGQN